MIKNYLKIAIRNLRSGKHHTLINISGLSISLAAVLLMLLWINDEWRIDKFHAHSQRIQKLLRIYPQEGNSLVVNPNIAYPMLQAIKQEVPEVETVVELDRPADRLLKFDELEYREAGIYSTSSLFQVFTFPVIIGDIEELDHNLNAVAISEKLARKLFSANWKNNSINKVLKINENDEFIVVAVFQDIPERSSIKFDYVLNFDHKVKNNSWLLDWGNKVLSGVLLLRENADYDLTTDKINTLYRNSEAQEKDNTFMLQSFGDQYLYTQFNDKAQAVGGRIEYLRIFFVAALFLLLIACINFVNLATARAFKRAKEVGVRKVIGANKRSLAIQFLIESSLLTIVAVGVAILLSEALFSTVNEITGKTLYFNYQSGDFWLSLLAVIIVTALLAGTYPALFLSSFKIATVFSKQTKEKISTAFFRKALVVLQFGLAILLIIGAVIVQQQIHYIKNKNLGLDKENLLIIPKDDNKLNEKHEVFQTLLRDLPGISSVSATSHSPLRVGASTTNVAWPGKRKEQENLEFNFFFAEDNFPETFGVNMSDGQYYKEGISIDSNNIVLNEKAIEMMGIEEPIGKTIKWWNQPRQIIGVIEDFHTNSLYNPIEPLAVILDAERTAYLFVKTQAGETVSAVASLQEAFAEVQPGSSLNYQFVDDQFQSVYKSETLTGTLANYFAIISIFVSCLGLFGLTSFLTAQKTKEIGIRKVLGASVFDILMLVTKNILVLVSIGLLIGIPVSWIMLGNWLDRFAYNIELHWWTFGVAALATLTIAFLTVSAESLKAALKNPVNALKNE